MSTQQFSACWRWTDATGTTHTAPFLFEDPDGDFLERVERYIMPRWRRDFPSNYASWAAEASRSSPKPIPYLNLPEPPLPELNVLFFPCVASQYAHMAAIFNVDIPVGQKVELVTNLPLWRRSSLFWGTFSPSEELETQYSTVLYVASRRTATGDQNSGPYVCLLVDWRYFARSVPFVEPPSTESDDYFFDKVLWALQSLGYVNAFEVNQIQTTGICSASAKAKPWLPLDQSVFTEGASLPLLIDAALYCRGAYLYNGTGVYTASTLSPRYPAQVGFPTVDATGINVPKPKYWFPDYWTQSSSDSLGQTTTVDPTPTVNTNKSLSLTGYVDAPAVLTAQTTDGVTTVSPSNLIALKTVALYIGNCIEILSGLSTSSTFWLGDYVGPDEYLYLPNGEFANEQNSIAGFNTTVWFPVFGGSSNPWDSKRGQILVDKTELGPFRYQYSSQPVEYVKSDFYTGWRFVGPIMSAENTIEASNSVIGVQGNGVSLGFEPVPSGDSNGVEESRVVLVTSGVYEVYYAADAPVPIGCGAVVDWSFDGSRFLFSVVNASQGWSGAAYGTLYADFTQNETRDALATVTLVGEDKALRSVIEAAGGYLNTARYMCYSPFSKPGDTMAEGTRVCVIRNAALKRFEIIQAECE